MEPPSIDDLRITALMARQGKIRTFEFHQSVERVEKWVASLPPETKLAAVHPVYVKDEPYDHIINIPIIGRTSVTIRIHAEEQLEQT